MCSKCDCKGVLKLIKRPRGLRQYKTGLGWLWNCHKCGATTREK